MLSGFSVSICKQATLFWRGNLGLVVSHSFCFWQSVRHASMKGRQILQIWGAVRFHPPHQGLGVHSNVEKASRCKSFLSCSLVKPSQRCHARLCGEGFQYSHPLAHTHMARPNTHTRAPQGAAGHELARFAMLIPGMRCNAGDSDRR